MKPPVLAVLAGHLAVLSSISFGGFPTVLPDVHNFIVVAHGWMTDQEFANIFAMAEAIPGPNMILMMGLVGWKVLDLPGALASATATFGPPYAVYHGSFRLWDRFRAARWQQSVRAGLAPVTIGLVLDRHGARGRPRMARGVAHPRRCGRNADHPCEPDVALGCRRDSWRARGAVTACRRRW
jgi:chromate transport protein ChrA